MNESSAVFNVGTGQGTSVMQVVEAFERQCNLRLNYIIGPRRAGDVEQIFADTTKIHQQLNWRPKYGIEEMMNHAWMWQKKITSS